MHGVKSIRVGVEYGPKLTARQNALTDIPAAASPERAPGDWKKGVPWNEDWERRVKELWALGTRASEVAEILHSEGLTGVSRNAVIGKAHRLGLDRHVNAKGGRAPKPKTVRVAIAGPASKAECRWPIGHPGEAGFRFCSAKPVVPGKPYCADHCALAYRARDEPSE